MGFVFFFKKKNLLNVTIWKVNFPFQNQPLITTLKEGIKITAGCSNIHLPRVIDHKISSNAARLYQEFRMQPNFNEGASSTIHCKVWNWKSQTSWRPKLFELSSSCDFSLKGLYKTLALCLFVLLSAFGGADLVWCRANM